MKIEIERLFSHDTDKFLELLKVFDEVFEEENSYLPDRDNLDKILGNTNIIILVASSNKIIVGGMLCYVLQHYSSIKPIVYIYELGVLPNFQRKGIGKLLISNLRSMCADQGIEVIFVQAEKIDDHALDFYRSTGASEQEVVHFTYKSKH